MDCVGRLDLRGSSSRESSEAIHLILGPVDPLATGAAKRMGGPGPGAQANPDPTPWVTSPTGEPDPDPWKLLSHWNLIVDRVMVMDGLVKRLEDQVAKLEARAGR